MCPYSRSEPDEPREGFIPVGKADLAYREIGQGRPILILHGGPDFDYGYLLPEMDRLAERFRLIYYDQRGRGRSARGVQPEDISLQSEIEDLDRVRAHFGLETAAVLGHSWGGLLALEYALRHPERVSHLILLNSAPASRDDYLLFRQERARRWPDDIEALKTLAATAGYQAGDPDAVADYYRVHFRAALRQPEHVARVVERLRASFTNEGILLARAIEARLMDDTWLTSGYDLLPALERLRIPTLVIHGEHDFIPVECAARIAQAIPGARFLLLPETGHFAYLERTEEVTRAVGELVGE